MVTTAGALPPSSKPQLQHSPNAKHTLLVVVEDEDSRLQGHVVVDARDRERGAY